MCVSESHRGEFSKSSVFFSAAGIGPETKSGWDLATEPSANADAWITCIGSGIETFEPSPFCVASALAPKPLREER